MELNLINDKKLKIILTPFDMSEYEISCENIDYDNTRTRKIIWDILDRAKNKTGFDAAADKIYIQVFPTKNGGCEMYVTKIRSENTLMPPMPENLLQKGADAVPDNITAYGFCDMDSLIKVCYHLSEKGYIGDSAAYAADDNFADKNRYFLVLDENIPFFSYKCKTLNQNAFISEFGTRYGSKSVVYYVKEHCKCFCEKDAVKILSDM